ncbi:MAG: signal recognition particle-docking protein FtsY [Aquificaceae bacterium]|nr:MAG: signal recognition particle-docking protein FtsY [Aquificaceae bacterium]
MKEPIVEEVIEQVEEKPIAEAVIEASEPQVDEIAKEQPLNVEKPKSKTKKVGLFSRLKQGLSRTGSSLTEGVSTAVLGKKQIDDDVFEELETRLLVADVGMEATMKIIDKLTEKVKRKELENIDALMPAMHQVMIEILRPVSTPLEIKDEHHPTVILMVGINGAGKTTTIGKLAKQYQKQGKSVMLAAGDTFRAAAVEQLQVWGERNDIPVVAQGTGADSASVIYDAMESAKAKGIDILLADTAGRLHTQDNLMEELKKVKRVMQKIDPEAPHEVMLIIDASIGQNALAQAKEFNAAIGVTGISVTKLDGTAKGGILFAIAEQAKIPVRFIGVGEGIDDLQEFDASKFVGALLAGEE